VKNTLAYSGMEFITAVKKFYDTEADVIKLFTALAANNRLGWKGLLGPNAQVFCANS
jgi:hypothetical protein